MSRSLATLLGLSVVVLSLGFAALTSVLEELGPTHRVMLPEPHIDSSSACRITPDRIPAIRARELLREQQILLQTLRVGNDQAGGEIYRNLLQQYPEAISLRFEYLRFLVRKELYSQARSYFSTVKEDLPDDRRTLLFRDALVALGGSISAEERSHVQDALSASLRAIPSFCG